MPAKHKSAPKAIASGRTDYKQQRKTNEGHVSVNKPRNFEPSFFADVEKIVNWRGDDMSSL